MLDLLNKPLDAKLSQLRGLTVGEVIAMLETFDPSAPLLVRGENGGFEEVLGFRTTGVALNVNTLEGFGPHDVPDAGEQVDVTAVVLRAGG